MIPTMRDANVIHAGVVIAKLWLLITRKLQLL